MSCWQFARFCWWRGANAPGPVAPWYVLGLAAIAIGGWLLTVVVLAIERGLLARHPDAELADRRSRHVRTKIILVARVTQALIVAVTVGAMLWTVPALRDVGAGLLASAGVVGVIVGLAAQTTLGNLFAGLQIAFTDAIRIDDIVVVQGQRGRIEEITLTYVAVRACGQHDHDPALHVLHHDAVPELDPQGRPDQRRSWRSASTAARRSIRCSAPCARNSAGSSRRPRTADRGRAISPSRTRPARRCS